MLFHFEDASLKTDRRSFIGLATPLAWSLVSAVRAQTVVERGGFDERQFPLVRQKLLDLLNGERTNLRLNQLQLDQLACDVGNDDERGPAE